MKEIEELARLAIDFGFSIHREFGPGLLEAVYESLMAQELADLGLRVERQKPGPLIYKGIQLDEVFRADLLIEGALLIELKSVERIAPVHPKQVLTYLRLLELPLGLLMNFGAGTFRDGLQRVINAKADLSRVADWRDPSGPSPYA